jgi:AcrR family transcriptional regulator
VSQLSADPTDVAPRRRYRSPHRAQQAERTRAAVIAAATRLFTADGWAATGMRDIAREAGVATETVYAHFSSKTGLFQQAMDVAVVGDAALVPLAGRPEFTAVGQGTRADRIAGAALLVTEVHQRTAGFAKALREAASSDGAIAEMLKATRERQRRDIAAGAEAVMGRKPTPRERDGLWALLSVEVYVLLVEESGWSNKKYKAWVAEMLERHIPSS